MPKKIAQLTDSDMAWTAVVLALEELRKMGRTLLLSAEAIRAIQLLERARTSLDRLSSANLSKGKAKRGTGRSADELLRRRVLDLRTRRSAMGIRAIAKHLGTTPKVVRVVLAHEARSLEPSAIAEELQRRFGPVPQDTKGTPNR